ncbi:helix-turn-helix domain-containing protein [soil metagenome]
MAPLDDVRSPDPNLVALAGQLLNEIESFAENVAAQIRLKVDYYRTEENVSFDELMRSTRENVQFVLQSFVQTELPETAAAEVTGRRRAEEGVPLAFVMAAFRVGFGQIWANVVEQARIRGTIASDALVDAASDIWSAHDMFAEAMAAAYRETVMTEMLRDERERSALVTAILEGRVIDEATLWDAADVLKLPSRGPFAVVVAQPARLAQEVLPDAERQLRRRDIASAWCLLPDLHVGILRFSVDDPDTDTLRGHLDAMTQGAVGVSPLYSRLNQTAQALRFARMALSGRRTGQTQVVLFDDAPLGIAAAAAPDAMERIRDSVLGPVLALAQDERSLLLSTLAAWRDNGGSTDAIARQMFCHPNTVRLRMRRLESFTGRLFTDPLAAAEVLLALEAVQQSFPAQIPPPA